MLDFGLKDYETSIFDLSFLQRVGLWTESFDMRHVLKKMLFSKNIPFGSIFPVKTNYFAFPLLSIKQDSQVRFWIVSFDNKNKKLEGIWFEIFKTCQLLKLNISKSIRFWIIFLRTCQILNWIITRCQFWK